MAAAAVSARAKSDIAHYFEYSSSGLEVLADGLQEMPFGEFLVERQALTRAQLFRALTEQDKSPGVRLGEVVAALGFVPAEQIDALLAEYQQLDVVEAE
jgi:hypothetical protein